MIFKPNNLIKVILLICLGLFIVNNACAITTILATSAEKKSYQKKLESIKNFVDSGIEYVRINGKDKAFKEFNNPKGKFRKGDLYLFAYDYQGTNLVYGVDPQNMVGKNFFNVRDIYGTTVFRLIAKVAKHGGGFVHYYWPKPNSNNIEYKTAYVAPLDNNIFIGSGLYENIEAPVTIEIKIEELKAFLSKAIEYYKTNGEKKAFAEFNNPHGRFTHGSVYVFVDSYDGVILANGADPKLVGQNYLDIKDEFGTPFMRMLIEAAKNGGGLVSYYWPNPETHNVELKTTYVIPLTDHSFICAGFYGA